MMRKWSPLLSLMVSACASLPSPLRRASEVWWIDLPSRTASPGVSVAIESPVRWLTLDSITFRPSWLGGARLGAAGEPALPTPARNRAAPPQTVSIVTLAQNAAAQPEIFRAVTEDRTILATTAGLIASRLDAAGTQSAILDVGGLAPGDLPALVTLLRSISDSLREHGVGTIAVAIPAADTLGYPTRPIARVAELIVVQLHEEHRAGTPAGPVFTLDLARRHLAMRAADAGPGRLVAGIPAYGYVWERSGSRRITYAEATDLAARSNLTLERDPSSLALHARSDIDQWELWIPDHRTITQIVNAARAMGVYRFAIYGAGYADPEILSVFRDEVRR